MTRRDPLQEFKTFQNRLFEPFFGRFDFLSDDLGNGTWAPPADVAEEDDRIVVRAEIQGMTAKDMRIQYEDGLLTLSGERTFERKDSQNYHRIERAYGTFSRSFSLPRSVDASKIMANYNNGVLEIEIPSGRSPNHARSRSRSQHRRKQADQLLMSSRGGSSRVLLISDS